MLALRRLAFVLCALLLAPTSATAAPSATTLPEPSAEALPTLPPLQLSIEPTPTCGVFCESAGLGRQRASANYHLDAWGNYRNPSELEASKNRFGFTGHLFDRETGTYYAKARYFDPELGRFLSQDSYLGEIDNPPSIHRYTWAHNRPTYYTDPTGHGVISLVGKAARYIVQGGEVMDIFADVQADYEALKQADSFTDRLGIGLTLASNLLPISAHDAVDLMDLGRAAMSGDFRGAGQVALGSTRAGRAVNAAVAGNDAAQRVAAGDFSGALRSGAQAVVNGVASATRRRGSMSPPGARERGDSRYGPRLPGSKQKPDRVTVEEAGSEQPVASRERLRPLSSQDVEPIDLPRDPIVAGDALRAKRDAQRAMRLEDRSLSDHDKEYYGGDGVVYRVPGSATPSGKPYVGSADDMMERTRSGRDGRDRTKAEQIGSYPLGDRAARKKAEQDAIDDEGGLASLDNQRNEIAEKKRRRP